MKRLRENYDTLHVSKSAKPKLRKAIISAGGKDLINSINECVLNVLVGNVPLSTCLKRKLQKYKLARRLAHKRVRHSAKKRLLIQKGGFFLALLTSILPIVAIVIFRSQSTLGEKHIMLRKVVLDSDTSSNVGGGPATSTLNPSRRRHRQSNQQTRAINDNGK